MNILFIDNLEPNPLLGGISRVISCLASSLKENYGDEKEKQRKFYLTYLQQ